jgi:hypothetical protein
MMKNLLKMRLLASIVAVVAVGLICHAGDAWAQCSSGRGSGMRAPGLPTSASASPLFSNSFSYPSSRLNMPVAYDMNRQLRVVQQQMVAARQQAQLQQAQLQQAQLQQAQLQQAQLQQAQLQQAQRYQDQQSLLSLRRERAERTRQLRADRIARAKAKRVSDRSNSLQSSSQTMLVARREEI